MSLLYSLAAVILIEGFFFIINAECKGCSLSMAVNCVSWASDLTLSKLCSLWSFQEEMH